MGGGGPGGRGGGGGVLKKGAVVLGTFPYSVAERGQVGLVRWERVGWRRAADMLGGNIWYIDVGHLEMNIKLQCNTEFITGREI